MLMNEMRNQMRMNKNEKCTEVMIQSVSKKNVNKIAHN